MLSEESVKALRDRYSEGPAKGRLADRSQGHGRRPRDERGRRGGNTPGGDESSREDRAEPSLAAERQRTSAESKARKAGEEPSHRAWRFRSSQRQAGWLGREAGNRAAEGETFEELNPRSVTGMKQGRKVAGGRRRQEGEKP